MEHSQSGTEPRNGDNGVKSWPNGGVVGSNNTGTLLPKKFT